MNFGRMPLYFIPNKGQINGPAAFYVQGKDKTLYFCDEGVTFVLMEKAKMDSKKDRPDRWTRALKEMTFENEKPTRSWTVKLDFVGANEEVNPQGSDETGAVISYFKGPEKDWKTGLPSYSKIAYRELWPGIDLVFSGSMNELKYEFVVKPGADPSQIRFRYRGAEKVSIDKDGRLEVTTPVASFKDGVPVAWQETASGKKDVSLAYDLVSETREDESVFSYGFSVGAYDPALPLVLDPAVIVYCGYIGGSNSEDGYGVAVDRAGCAYITGFTCSTEATFPIIVGPYLNTYGNDAFIAKLKADGTGLIYCGFIGGVGGDRGKAIAVDGSGCAYIAGVTSSTETSFPVKVGPDLTFSDNSEFIYDAFVAKVEADGTALIYCGYIGGSAYDEGDGIAVDGSGCAYISGYTDSTEATFPVTVGPDLIYNNISGKNIYDAFVAKVRADGTGLSYCGYIGGSSYDFGWRILVDIQGCAYVTGTTQSNEASFPVTVGPDMSFNGGGDIFVAKVKPDGTGLIYCGYIGGPGGEMGTGIAVDQFSCAYITGYTTSNEKSFPVTVGPDSSYNGGWEDAFVVKVRADGKGLVYCGYIGGGDAEEGQDIAVDRSGSAYIIGSTNSTEATFPVREGPDLSYNGGAWDAFVAKVRTDGKGLVYCGYVGGIGYESGFGIAVDSSGDAYITGRTDSLETSFPVKLGPDLTHNSHDDAFVAKIKMIPWLRVTSPNGGEKWEAGTKHPITWESSDYEDQDKILYSTDKGKAWTTIATTTPDDGRYYWTVPNAISPTCWVRINKRDNSAKDRSDRVFAIVPMPTIKVVVPNGGETWKAKTVHTIRWTTTGTLASVKIEYSTDDGLNWANIIASTPNTGSYAWTVPNKSSTACRVRVRKPGSMTPADTSDGKFSIIGL